VLDALRQPAQDGGVCIIRPEGMLPLPCPRAPDSICTTQTRSEPSRRLPNERSEHLLRRGDVAMLDGAQCALDLVYFNTTVRLRHDLRNRRQTGFARSATLRFSYRHSARLIETDVARALFDSRRLHS